MRGWNKAYNNEVVASLHFRAICIHEVMLVYMRSLVQVSLFYFFWYSEFLVYLAKIWYIPSILGHVIGISLNISVRQCIYMAKRGTNMYTLSIYLIIVCFILSSHSILMDFSCRSIKPIIQREVFINSGEIFSFPVALSCSLTDLNTLQVNIL